MGRHLVIAFVLGFLFLQGCGNLGEDEHEGKTFKIRTELRSGEGVEVLTWEGATELEFNDEEYVYRFKVGGKMVLLDPVGTVIVEEQ